MEGNEKAEFVVSLSPLDELMVCNNVQTPLAIVAN